MQTLTWLYRRLIHRYDNLGVRGLLGLRRMPRLPDRVAAPHPFDLEHGTDTGGFQPGAELVTDSSADLFNTAYYAISPSTLSAAIGRIPDSLETYTFVDLGCGKGRALLVAASFPVAQALGVEISPVLCGVARRNTASEPRIRILERDAATVVYPQTPLIVFLYHPFLKPVLRRVLANFERQLRADPRPTWLLYANPSYAGFIARTGFLEQVWDLNLPLSAADAAVDRHGITWERYTLYRGVLAEG